MSIFAAYNKVVMATLAVAGSVLTMVIGKLATVGSVLTMVISKLAMVSSALMMVVGRVMITMVLNIQVTIQKNKTK